MKQKNIELNLTSWDKVEKGVKPTASFIVRSMDGKLVLNIQDGIIGGIITSEGEIPLKQEITEKFPYMNDVVVNDLEENDIGVLLGSRFLIHFAGKEIRKGKVDEPIAILTELGWAIAGPIPDVENYNLEIAQMGVTREELSNIDKMIRQMYRHDFISRPGEDFPAEYTHSSQFDEFSMEQIRETVKFDKKEMRYSVGIPWRLGREETRKILARTDTWSYALNRTKKLRHKLWKNPILLEGAFKQIEDNLDNGYAKVITDLSAPAESPVCYLACHIALHDEKPGKFRVCQDAAGKVDGICLNKFLLTGPDVMKSLFGIILRFRRRRVVLSADIKDFFYRILMDKKDRSAIRFLWYSDRTLSNIVVIEGLCHLFGLASSPGISNWVLQFHGVNIREEFGLEVFIAMLLQFYVDDYIDSLDTVEEGHIMKRKLTEACRRGGFKLCKWKSNFPELNDPDPLPLPAETENVAENRSNDDGEDDEGVSPSFISSPKSPRTAIDVDIDDERGDGEESPRSAEIIGDERGDGDEHVEGGDLQEELKTAFEEGESERQGFTKDLGNKILGVG